MDPTDSEGRDTGPVTSAAANGFSDPPAPASRSRESRGATADRSLPTDNSQESLTLSIVRAVQAGLPGSDSEEAIRTSVNDVLLIESCRNEQLLAYVRTGLVGTAVILSFIAYHRPSVLGLRTFVPEPAIAATLFFIPTAAFSLLLARDWYLPALRHAVPISDSMAIVFGFWVLYTSLARIGEPVPVGSYGTVAVACSLIAFSGTLRLSRSSAYVAAAFSLIAWICVWFIGRPPIYTAFVTTPIVFAAGALGSRITRIIRRVVTDEVTRLTLIRMYSDAQQAINAREEVLKRVSHDLRNPLGTIAMVTDFLLETPLPDEQRARHLGIIKRQGERMGRLINDLLDAARIQAGILGIEPDTVQIADLFESVTEMMRPLANDRHIELRAGSTEGLPAIRVDAERVNQVFSNLIGNAIKFTPEFGQITLGAARMDDKIRLSVSDTGPGIPPEILGRIFGNMWQARRNDTRGIGLGLTIAKAIVEAHGEQIGVVSHLGEGTEFWFTARISEPDPPPESG